MLPDLIRYIADDARFTEADIRAFMTLVRMDEVYSPVFRVGARPIAQYVHRSSFNVHEHLEHEWEDACDDG